MPANRFKKSIENATDNTKKNMEDATKDIENKNTLKSTAANAIVNTQADISNASGDILGKVLENDKRDKGSNHTVYLSADVGEALVKLAKASKKSKSTLVDGILREVLINRN